MSIFSNFVHCFAEDQPDDNTGQTMSIEEGKNAEAIAQEECAKTFWMDVDEDNEQVTRTIWDTETDEPARYLPGQ
ncbi:MAG: hypothetical protein ACRCZS_19300 [Chroococcidiopsis sp.]